MPPSDAHAVMLSVGHITALHRAVSFLFLYFSQNTRCFVIAECTVQPFHKNTSVYLKNTSIYLVLTLRSYDRERVDGSGSGASEGRTRGRGEAGWRRRG
jgi:hypothetical protein